MVTKNRIFYIIHQLHKRYSLPFSIVKLSSLMFSNKLTGLSSSRSYLKKIFPDNGGSSYGNNLLKIQYDLQIVVAAYNCEQTIKTCLCSILNQKTKYRVITKVIDDGSIDNTGEIIDHIAEKANGRLNIIHQTNKGLSGARNTGIKVINGKFLMFVDADDTLADGAIESLLDNAYKYNGDIVEGGYNILVNNDVRSTFKHSFSKKVNPFNTLYGYPWGKLYRSYLFKNVVFPKEYWFEDTVAMYRIWPNAKHVVTVKNVVYNYYKNTHGITATYRGKAKSLDTLWVTQKLLNECNNINMQTYNFTLSQIVMNTQRLSYLSDKVNKANFVISRYWVEHYFSGYETNDKKYLMIEYILKSGTYKDFLNYVYEE